MTLDIRRRLEQQEERLSAFAARSVATRGRARPEPPPPLRTEFQRDRDRILHSKAFRRLKHKTQVFLEWRGDHYTTRLTHTLEVSQIARTIARALNLNEDLAEAIALGHDLGHTPFGHAGEATLASLSPYGFRHNEQSLRIVDHLEKKGQGLNLTWEVRDGILNHSKPQGDIFSGNGATPATLEGQVVRTADALAYVNHDLTDALRAGIIARDDLPQEAMQVLGDSPSQRINTMVCDLVAHSWTAEGPSPDSLSSPAAIVPPLAMSPQVREATNLLRGFLFARVYQRCGKMEATRQAQKVLEQLYRFFLAHPEKLPEDYGRAEDSVPRRVTDYLAGMTDGFAWQVARELGLVSETLLFGSYS